MVQDCSRAFAASFDGNVNQLGDGDNRNTGVQNDAKILTDFSE